MLKTKAQVLFHTKLSFHAHDIPKRGIYNKHIIVIHGIVWLQSLLLHLFLIIKQHRLSSNPLCPANVHQQIRPLATTRDVCNVGVGCQSLCNLSAGLDLTNLN